MALRCGIVGLPNVGKSTLFNALTRARVLAENYPFATIDPNVGVVAVPDPRLQEIAALARARRIVPAAVQFVDIAGLVSGASRGEGLGNQFLAHIREVDAVAHVVRVFADPNITHVSSRLDPADDIATVNTELALADLASVERALARATKGAKVGDKEQQRLQTLLERLQAHLDAGAPARRFPLADDEQAPVRALCLLTAKPMFYIANVSESDLRGSAALDAVERLAAREDSIVVPVCAAIEAEIAELDDGDKEEFLRELGLEEPGLNRVIRAAYRLLGLQTFFTAGDKEARAWTVRIGATALEAAGAIHSDFERGFIRAETASYEDYVRCAGEHGARDAGVMRSEGRDYVVRDGDVIHFRFNV